MKTLIGEFDLEAADAMQEQASMKIARSRRAAQQGAERKRDSARAKKGRLTLMRESREPSEPDEQYL